jgi:hypothetical protein
MPTVAKITAENAPVYVNSTLIAYVAPRTDQHFTTLYSMNPRSARRGLAAVSPEVYSRRPLQGTEYEPVTWRHVQHAAA